MLSLLWDHVSAQAAQEVDVPVDTPKSAQGDPGSGQQGRGEKEEFSGDDAAAPKLLRSFPLDWQPPEAPTEVHTTVPRASTVDEEDDDAGTAPAADVDFLRRLGIVIHRFTELLDEDGAMAREAGGGEMGEAARDALIDSVLRYEGLPPADMDTARERIALAAEQVARSAGRQVLVRWAEAQWEGGRSALTRGDLLEARARLRSSLEALDSALPASNAKKLLLSMADFFVKRSS